ncbi:MAG: hypothetical protein U0263_29000 [Polyangiaceae bacterium]
MPDLISSDGGGGDYERCARCGALAAGPCARCGRSVCGDCCVLTEGGTRTYAICLACEDRAGKGLGGAWRGLLGFIALPIVGLFVAVLLLSRCQ